MEVGWRTGLVGGMVDGISEGDIRGKEVVGTITAGGGQGGGVKRITRKSWLALLRVNVV